MGNSAPPASVTVNWTFNDGNTGAQGSGGSQSVNGSIVVSITATNTAPTGSPTITGTTTEGQTLTADISGIADADGLGAFSYQWLRDGVDIASATGSSYSLSQADVGAQISVRVSYLDGGGTTEELTSSQTVSVSGVNSAPVFDAGDGYHVQSLATLYDSVVDVAILSDGSYITLSGVNTASSGQDLDFGLMKYNADGTVDTGWGTNGVVLTAVNSNNETVTSLSIQSDGKIVVAGAYSTGATSDGIVMRYNADGTLDTSFSTDGKAEIQFVASANDFVRDMEIQSDGKIVVVGDASIGGDYQAVAARLNSDGTLDNSFGTSGKAFLGCCRYRRIWQISADSTRWQDRDWWLQR